jgi:capsular polysaccharide biosynthesis protein
MRSFSPRAGLPWLALVTLTAAGAAAAAGYALTAPKHYRATAQLIVTPTSDAAFTGIDVLRDSGGRRTAAESAAALAEGPLVADAVRALLGLRRSRDALLGALDAHVVGSSDVVALTVEDTSANGAAQIANAFADTLVNQRTASFQSEVVAAVRRYGAVLSRMTPAERDSAAGAELMRRLAVLESVQGQPDPTLKHAGQATAPTSASWPDAATLVGLGAGIGAALGVVTALVLLAARARRAPGAAVAVPASADAVEQLVERLEGRLSARESAFAARERDLQHAMQELRSARADALADDSDLAGRERRLEERVAAVTRREAEIARRAAELAVREREQTQPPPPPPARAEPPPALVRRPPPADGGSYSIVALQRLVDERGSEFPDRVEEWTAYLFFLREYAGPDGAVPAGFDWLVEETFGELVG